MALSPSVHSGAAAVVLSPPTYDGVAELGMSKASDASSVVVPSAVLQDKLNRARMLIENAERELEAATAEKAKVARDRAAFEHEKAQLMTKLSDTEARSEFLLKEVTATREKVDELRNSCAAADERARAAEAETTTRAAAHREELSALREEHASALREAVEAHEQQLEQQSLQSIAAIDQLNDVLLAQREEIARLVRHGTVDKEKIHRLALMVNESESRTTAWELLARFALGASQVAHAAAIAGQPVLLQPSPERQQRYMDAIGNVYAAVDTSPARMIVNVPNQNVSQLASAPLVAQHALVVKVKELETSLARATTELDKERAASKQLRDSLSSLYQTPEHHFASTASSSLHGGGQQDIIASTESHRRDITNILQAGENAKLRSMVEVERSRSETLAAELAKVSMSMRETTDECATLSAENESISAALRKAAAEARQWKAECTTQEVRREDVERKLESANAEISRLSAKLNAAASIEHQLQTDLEAALAANGRLDTSLSAANAKLLATYDAAALQRELQSSQAERDSAVSALHRLNERHAELVKSTIPVTTHTEEVASLQNELHVALARNKSLEENAVQAVTSATKAAEDASKLLEARQSITHLEAALRNAMDASENAIMANAKQNAMFQDKIDACVSEIGTLRYQLHSSQQRLLEYSALQQTPAPASRRGRSPHRAQDNEVDAQDEIAFMASKLMAAAEEIDRLTEERDRLNDQLQRHAMSSSAGGSQRAAFVVRSSNGAPDAASVAVRGPSPGLGYRGVTAPSPSLPRQRAGAT